MKNTHFGIRLAICGVYCQHDNFGILAEQFNLIKFASELMIIIFAKFSLDGWLLEHGSPIGAFSVLA